MVDKNITGQSLNNILILDNKSLAYLKDELIFKINWFDIRKIISTIRHFNFMLESKSSINDFKDHINYLNDKKEEIIHLMRSLSIKNKNDKLTNENELIYELRISTKLRLINSLMNNLTYFCNIKIYNQQTKLNLIEENNQLIKELLKLNMMNIRKKIEVTNKDSNDDYLITDLSNNKCDLIYLKEQELKEQKLKDQKLKEQELKDQELKDQELKDQELKDHELKDQELQDVNNNSNVIKVLNEELNVDEKNDSLFNLTNVIMDEDGNDFTFLKANQMNKIDLINLNNVVLKENDKTIELDNISIKSRKSNDYVNSEHTLKRKSIKNIVNDDVDVENHLRNHYTICEGEFVTLDHIYNTFMENFEIDRNKNPIKSSIGKCIKKLFNNNGQIKILTKVINGRPTKIYSNLKAN